MTVKIKRILKVRKEFIMVSALCLVVGSFVSFQEQLWLQVLISLPVKAQRAAAVQDADYDNNGNNADYGKPVYALNRDVEASLYKHFYPHPLPTDDDVIAFHPVLGSHRPNQDAVMTFCTGYEVDQIILFVQTLYATEYEGDLVMAMASNMSNKTRAFLQDVAEMHAGFVVYEIRSHCDRRQLCTLDQPLYGKQETNGTITLIPDQRKSRRMDQLRYEVFWIWATRYTPKSKLLFLDSRDSYFQRQPFRGQEGVDSMNETTIHFYEDMMTVGQSLPQMSWIRKQFPDDWEKDMNGIMEEMTICSGSTMGGRAAMETYARAMVQYSDKYALGLVGGDQGIHHYIIRRDRLLGAPNITTIVMYKQGYGMVNTIGTLYVKKKRPLRSMGIVDNTTNEILQADGNPTPIVHMFDRDPEIKAICANKTQQLLQEWNSSGSVATWQ